MRDGPSVDATDTFSWTVTNTNQAPVFSTDIVNRTDAEGALDRPRRRRHRRDGDTLTYSATGLPAGIAINSSTGVISGTLSFSSAGVYNVALTV